MRISEVTPPLHTYHLPFLLLQPELHNRMGFFKGGNRGTQLYMRSDSHGERMQKVYALDYCAASFVTEGKQQTLSSVNPDPNHPHNNHYIRHKCSVFNSFLVVDTLFLSARAARCYIF